MALTRITKGVIKPNENYDTHNINSTGIITATALDISGNASIAGVLTYEDVTSIDSVGIITAQNGLHVLNGYVGIGTAFPGEALDINSKTNSRAIRVYSEGSSSTSKLVLRTGDSGTSKIHFGDTSDIDTGEIRYRHNGDIMSFHVDANSERLTLDSDRLIIGENLSNNQPTYNSSTTLVTTHTNNPGAWNAIAIISGNTTGASFLKFGDRDDEDVSQIGHYNDDNSLRFYTNGGNERLRIDSDGRSLFTRGGLTASRNVGTKTGEIQVANSGNSSAISIIGYSNEVGGGHLVFGKSRAGNATGSTIVQSGDRLGEIAFCGADGTDIDSFGAAIKAHVDGTPGANDMPGRLQFYTTGDGGSSAVERVRIDSSGFVGIDNTSPNLSLAGARNLVIGSGSGDRGLTIMSGTSGVGHIEFSDGTGNSAQQAAGGIRYYHNSNYMRFNTNGGTERLRIASNGQVTISSGGFLTIDTNPASTYGVAEALRIDDGAGVNDRALQIFEYHHSGARYHRIQFNTNTTTNGSAYTHTQGNYGGSSAIEFGANGELKFYANSSDSSGSTSTITPTERLRITSDGQLLLMSNTGFNPSSSLLSLATDSSAAANMLSDSSSIYNHNNPAFVHVQNMNNTGDGQEAGIILHSKSSFGGAWAIYGKRTTSSYKSDLIFRGRSGSSSSAERLRIASDGEVKVNGDGSGTGYLRVVKDRDTAYSSNGGNNQDLIVQQFSDATNTQGYSSIGLQCNYTGQTGAWVAINAVRTAVGEADLTINPRNNTTGDVERLRITSDGKLLLGTTDTGFSGSYTDMTIGNASTQNTGLTIASSPTNGYSRLHFADANSGAATYAGFIAYSHADDALLVGTNNSGTEKLRMHSNGRLQLKNTITSSVQTHFEIGDTQGSFDFQMSDSSGGSDFIKHVKKRFVGKNTYGLTISSRSTLGSSYTGTGDASIKFYYPSAGGGAQAGSQLEFWTNQNGYAGTSEAKRMQISNSGNIGAPNGNNIYNASDERLKENMVELTNGLDKIKKLKPISFNWKDGWDECMSGKKEYGFGAQTTQVVDEMLVEAFGTEDTLLNGEVITNPLRVNEKYIIPLLVKAIQEQQEQIETLKTEVDALKSS